jgi:hypothetical protein
MAIQDNYRSDLSLSTNWIPLDGLIQQWGRCGTGANNASALHAIGLIFSALAREITDREHYMAAWHSSQKVDMTDLESAIEELCQAREHWADAMAALGTRSRDTALNEARRMVAQLMEQRIRVSALIQEIEQEQLAVYK